MRGIYSWVIWGLLASLEVGAREIRVPEDFPTIQAAVDAATHGDSVSLAPGV